MTKYMLKSSKEERKKVKTSMASELHNFKAVSAGSHLSIGLMIMVLPVHNDADQLPFHFQWELLQLFT